MSKIVSVAVRLPVAEGVNVPLIVHLAPAASDLPHVLVSAKLLLLEPLIPRLVMLRAALPVLLRVTVRAALVAPTASLPKAMLVGERLAVVLPLAFSGLLRASAMQAVERITALAICRRAALLSMEGAPAHACYPLRAAGSCRPCSLSHKPLQIICKMASPATLLITSIPRRRPQYGRTNGPGARGWGLGIGGQGSGVRHLRSSALICGRSSAF